MENMYYGFDVLVVLLIIHAFTKKRKPGINSLMMVAPWRLFGESFRRTLDLECRIEAKNQLRNGIYGNPVHTMNFVFFAILVLVITSAYLSTQLCHPLASIGYVMYRLYRLPMQLYSVELVKKYLENPKQIGNVA
jgi:uncharacterized membrane protein YoaK (UPF0700 family)